MFLLQRTPVLRTAVMSEFVLEAGAGTVLKGIFAGATALGLVQTVAGATTFTASPSSPASATVGVQFDAALAVTGAKGSTKSYKISGDLAPGLSISGINSSSIVNSSTLAISGIPTTQGSYTLGIKAYGNTNATGDTDNKTYNYTITVAAGTSSNVAPSISTQPSSVTVNAGSTASFSVMAAGTPTPTYQWRKDGVAVNGATNASFTISSVSSTDAGNYTVVVTNSVGAVTSSAAVLTVNVPPTISSQPSSLTVSAGASASFSVTATGSPTPTYQWRKDGTSISGATGASYSISSTTSADAGSYTVLVTNGAGSVTSSAATLTVNAVTSSTLAISDQPISQTIAPGGSATLSVGVTSSSSVSVQWYRNDVAIAGATGSTLTLAAVTSNNTGRYYAVVSDGVSQKTTRDAYLLVATPNLGGIVNESVLTSVKSGDPLTVGFVINDGPRAMLIRGVGPSLGLAPFNISGVLAGPQLELFASGNATALETNVGWNNLTAVADAAATVGAFGLTSSRDAAVLRTLSPIPHSAVITSADGSAGLAIVEAYAVPGTGTGRLVNMSALKRIDDSNTSLTAGFSIDGNVPVKVLIRAVGPSLNQFMGGAELADTTLILNRLVGPNGETVGVVLENDDWINETNAAEITSVAASVGAFPLTANSADAAVLVTLPAGNYTAQVGRKGTAVGSALIEVYLVD